MNLRRLLFLLMLVPVMATAQTIKSPNGNIVLTFSLMAMVVLLMR